MTKRPARQPAPDRMAGADQAMATYRSHKPVKNPEQAFSQNDKAAATWHNAVAKLFKKEN